LWWESSGCFFCGRNPLPVSVTCLRRAGEQQIDATGGAEGGRGIATAGKILGIIGTVLS
jgi:hypothetical protein